MVKYPQITIYIDMQSEQGNPISILGEAIVALEEYGVDEEIRGQLIKEVANKDYNHLLQTIEEWVNVSYIKAKKYKIRKATNEDYEYSLQVVKKYSEFIAV